MPRGMLGSYWGSGSYNKNITNTFKEIIEQKTERAKNPFKPITDKDKRKDFYRVIPMKRFGIQIYKKDIEILKKDYKFDFYEWFKKFESIKGTKLTKEYENDVNKIIELLAKGEKLKENSKMYKVSIRCKLGDKRIDRFPETKIDELLTKIKEKSKELEKINNEIKELRIKTNNLYHENYSDFNVKDFCNVLSYY